MPFVETDIRPGQAPPGVAKSLQLSGVQPVSVSLTRWGRWFGWRLWHVYGGVACYRWFTYYTWWFSMAMLNNQMVHILVGALEHEFYDFPRKWECHNPNWQTHILSEGLKPPTNICLCDQATRIWPFVKNSCLEV